VNWTCVREKKKTARTRGRRIGRPAAGRPPASGPANYLGRRELLFVSELALNPGNVQSDLGSGSGPTEGPGCAGGDGFGPGRLRAIAATGLLRWAGRLDVREEALGSPPRAPPPRPSYWRPPSRRDRRPRP